MDIRVLKVIGMGLKIVTDDMLIVYFVYREIDDLCGIRWSGSYYEVV